MKQEINFRIIEIIEACRSIHVLKREEENHISIKRINNPIGNLWIKTLEK